ncbi:hypothetical protein CBS101457_001639 [Exobasidium rhododendri]|nr:hypothetical protein CBS101457_001639 [Exobasidium rhododendri]
MGVKWLTGFVKDIERIVSSQISFDVAVEGEDPKSGAGPRPTFVVDAWAFLYHIWLNYFGDSMRGLDYHAYQRLIQTIVQAWQTVGIQTIFVFDGPFLPAKLPKIIERRTTVTASNSVFMKSSSTSRSSKRFQMECGVVAPLLLQALIGVIDHLHSDKVEMIFASTEADSLVAEIATEKERGYAISQDSDFFILCARGKGCPYVPLDSIEYLVTIPPAQERPDEASLPSNVEEAADVDGFEKVGKRKRGAKKSNGQSVSLHPSNFSTQQIRATPPIAGEKDKLSSVRIRAHRSQDLASHLQIPSTLLSLLAALVGNDYTTTLQSNVLFKNLQGPQRIGEAASILRSEWLRVMKGSKVGSREGTKVSVPLLKGALKLQMSISDTFDDGRSDVMSSPSSATATPTRNTPTPYHSSIIAPFQAQDPVRAMVQIIVDRLVNQQADAGLPNARYITTGERELIIESVIDSAATYSLLSHSNAPHLSSPSALFFEHASSIMMRNDMLDGAASPEALERYREAYAKGQFKPSLIEAMTQRLFLSSLSAEDADVKSVQSLAVRELRYWLWGVLFEVWGMAWARDEWDEPADLAMHDDDLSEEEVKTKNFLAMDKGYKEGERPDDVISVDTDSSNEAAPEGDEDDEEFDDLLSRPGSVAELRKEMLKPAPGVVEYIRKGQSYVGELVQIVPLLSLLNGDLYAEEEGGSSTSLPASLAQLRGQHEAAQNRPGNTADFEPASDPVPSPVALMSLGTRLDLFLHAHRSCISIIQSIPRKWWTIAAILRLSILHEAQRLGPAKRKLNWSRGELIAAIQSACHHSYRGSSGNLEKEKEIEESSQEAVRQVFPTTRAIHLASSVQLLLETSHLLAQSLLLPVDEKEWLRPHTLYHGPTFHLKMSDAGNDVEMLEKSLKKQERSILDAVTFELQNELGIDVSELRKERKAKKKEAAKAKAEVGVIEENGKSFNRSRSRAQQATRNNFALLGED